MSFPSFGGQTTSLFGSTQQPTTAFGGGFGQSTGIMTAQSHNPMKDIEVPSPPDDSISALVFSPPALQMQNFLVAGSWDGQVRCWEVAQAPGMSSTWNVQPKASQSHQSPVLDAAWSDVSF